MIGADIIFQLETNAIAYAYVLGSCTSNWRPHTLLIGSAFKKLPVKHTTLKLKCLLDSKCHRAREKKDWPKFTHILMKVE